MTQSTDAVSEIVNRMLKIDDRGWNIALFEDAHKASNYLCAHCGEVCCDAVELGCQHEDSDEIFMHCHYCLSELVSDIGNRCTISGHHNPPLDAARSIRRQILKSIVVCPYSLTFTTRNNFRNNNNSQQNYKRKKKRFHSFESTNNNTKFKHKCKWKGMLSELISKHIIQCAKKNDPKFTLNVRVQQLENENILLIQQIINLQNNKEKEINNKNEQIKKLKKTLFEKKTEINILNNQINQQIQLLMSKNSQFSVNEEKFNIVFQNENKHNSKQLNDKKEENKKLKKIIKDRDKKIKQLNNEIASQSLIIKEFLQSNDEKNEFYKLLKKQIKNNTQKEEKKQNEKKQITKGDTKSFQIFKANKYCIIDLDNLIFTTQGIYDMYATTYGIIQTEWSKYTNNGIHHMKLKCLQSAKNWISIGMITNNATETSNWLFDSKECGISYQLYVSHKVNDSGIYVNKDGKEQYKQSISKRTAISDDWTSNAYGPNETMEIKLDFNSLELMFFVNSQQVGKTLKIKSDIYYPAVAYGVNNFNFDSYGTLKVKLLSLY